MVNLPIFFEMDKHNSLNNSQECAKGVGRISGEFVNDYNKKTFSDMMSCDISPPLFSNHLKYNEPKHKDGGIRWDFPVQIIGQKTPSVILHICEECHYPILIYGRLMPCRHILCFDCAIKSTQNTCAKCKDKIQRIEKAYLGQVHVCCHNVAMRSNFSQNSHDICSKGYLSLDDLNAHVQFRHVQQHLPSSNKPALKDKPLFNISTVPTSVSTPQVSTGIINTMNFSSRFTEASDHNTTTTWKTSLIKRENAGAQKTPTSNPNNNRLQTNLQPPTTTCTSNIPALLSLTFSPPHQAPSYGFTSYNTFSYGNSNNTTSDISNLVEGNSTSVKRRRKSPTPPPSLGNLKSMESPFPEYISWGRGNKKRYISQMSSHQNQGINTSEMSSPQYHQSSSRHIAATSSDRTTNTLFTTMTTTVNILPGTRRQSQQDLTISCSNQGHAPLPSRTKIVRSNSRSKETGDPIVSCTANSHAETKTQPEQRTTTSDVQVFSQSTGPPLPNKPQPSPQPFSNPFITSLLVPPPPPPLLSEERDLPSITRPSLPPLPPPPPLVYHPTLGKNPSPTSNPSSTPIDPPHVISFVLPPPPPPPPADEGMTTTEDYSGGEGIGGSSHPYYEDVDSAALLLLNLSACGQIMGDEQLSAVAAEEDNAPHNQLPQSGLDLRAIPQHSSVATVVRPSPDIDTPDDKEEILEVVKDQDGTLGSIVRELTNSSGIGSVSSALPPNPYFPINVTHHNFRYTPENSRSKISAPPPDESLKYNVLEAHVSRHNHRTPSIFSSSASRHPVNHSNDDPSVQDHREQERSSRLWKISRGLVNGNDSSIVPRNDAGENRMDANYEDAAGDASSASQYMMHYDKYHQHALALSPFHLYPDPYQAYSQYLLSKKAFEAFNSTTKQLPPTSFGRQSPKDARAIAETVSTERPTRGTKLEEDWALDSVEGIRRMASDLFKSGMNHPTNSVTTPLHHHAMSYPLLPKYKDGPGPLLSSHYAVKYGIPSAYAHPSWAKCDPEVGNVAYPGLASQRYDDVTWLGSEGLLDMSGAAPQQVHKVPSINPSTGGGGNNQGNFRVPPFLAPAYPYNKYPFSFIQTNPYNVAPIPQYVMGKYSSHLGVSSPGPHDGTAETLSSSSPHPYNSRHHPHPAPYFGLGPAGGIAPPHQHPLMMTTHANAATMANSSCEPIYAADYQLKLLGLKHANKYYQQQQP